MTSRLPGSHCVSCKVNRQAVPCLPGAGVKGLALVKQASSPAAWLVTRMFLRCVIRGRFRAILLA